MADSKKNNAKVATPKSGSSPAPKDNVEGLSKAIGSRVRLITASQTYEGTLFTADPVLGLAAIDTKANGLSSGSSIGDFHIVPVTSIQSFSVTGQASGDAATQSFGPPNQKRAKERVEARVNALKEQAASRGKGVTKEAQAIFDALKRVNIPIRWHDKQMIAHEAVIIGPPYRPEDCKGPKDKQQVLSQVKKVLEGERRKLKEREDRESKQDLNQRKGG